MGLLEDYFVPLHNFFLTPESFEQKVTMALRDAEIGRCVGDCFLFSQVHNVAFAFELMQDGGLKKPKARPEGSFTFRTELFDEKKLLQDICKKLSSY